ncbi:putative toxin-antitoxin system toxin component, PIN family [Algoriphagus sp.]|uniref:putative toxin-antitoxin system toxin component, PIN family n=1 Tax=Algoriphagus sp. TaxID=1872435 RepID=UPI00391878D5
MKVVIDTNVLLRSIPKISSLRPIFDQMISGQFSVCISESILQEYQEVIGSKTSPTVGKNLVELFLSLQNVELIDVYYQWGLIIRDWDDNKFVDCALAGNADFIVSDDKHFEVLSKIDFPKVLCIDANTFLKKINQSKI